VLLTLSFGSSRTRMGNFGFVLIEGGEEIVRDVD
jgi:hypothetical protein